MSMQISCSEQTNERDAHLNNFRFPIYNSPLKARTQLLTLIFTIFKMWDSSIVYFASLRYQPVLFYSDRVSDIYQTNFFHLYLFIIFSPFLFVLLFISNLLFVHFQSRETQTQKYLSYALLKNGENPANIFLICLFIWLRIHKVKQL